MKIIKSDGNRLVAYVKKRDVEILFTMKEFISPNFFEEKSIVNGDVNSKGYYKIRDPENIRYLKQLPYIADYNVLSNMDIFSLNSLEGNMSFNLQKLILLFDSNEEFSSSTFALLNSISCIDKGVVTYLQKSTLPKDQERAEFALKQQVRCYNYSIREMIYKKNLIEAEKREEEKEEKKLTLRRVFRKIKGKLKN